MRPLLLLLALTTAAQADDRDHARRAAQRSAAEAARAKDAAKWVACGNAYLAVHNQFPGPDSDDILYNAGICFREGKAIGLALQVYDLLLRDHPRSRLAMKALAATGSLYAQIAQFDQAAERLEDYARKYAGERDALTALSDATWYRRGLGDRTRVIANTQYLVKTFARKHPALATEAMMNLTPAYDGDPAAQLAHLRGVLKVYRLDDGQRAVVHAKIGDLLSAQSCPTPLQDGLCVTVVRSAKADALPRCTTAIPRVVLGKRTPAYKDALAAYQQAAQLHAKVPVGSPGQQAAAMARLALVDADLERLVGLTFPSRLNFDPDPSRDQIRKRSMKQFADWLREAQALAAEISDRYRDVIALKEPRSSMIAAARVGQTVQAFWRTLRTGEIPADVRKEPHAQDKSAAYCQLLDEAAAPLATQASDAFRKCLELGAEAGIVDAFTRTCRGEGAVVDAASFLPPDQLPDPADVVIPMLADTIGEPSWRAGRRDTAIKAWEGALAKDGKQHAPRVNLAIGLYEQLRALPASDARRKQLEAEIIRHAQSALAVDSHPAPLVVLGALALADPRTHELAGLLLQRAVRLDDKYAPAQLGLGVLAVRRDQWPAALAHLERAAKLAPSSEPIQLAFALASLRVGRYRTAAATLARLKVATYDVELARGVAARGLGKLDDARAAYQRAVKLDAARPEAAHNLGALGSKP
jgi:tetratricopeptide (TPR) repeat protein